MTDKLEDIKERFNKAPEGPYKLVTDLRSKNDDCLLGADWDGVLNGPEASVSFIEKSWEDIKYLLELVDKLTPKPITYSPNLPIQSWIAEEFNENS